MNTAAEGLHHLHQLHLQLEEVREKLAQGPRRIKAAHQRVEKREAEIEELKDRLTQLKMKADQKSLQLKTNEANIAQLKARLNAAKTNKEFDVIKSQIDADTMANSVLEDEILAVLERIDRLKDEIAEAEKQRDAAREEERRTVQEVEATAPQLREQAAALEEALVAAEQVLPEKVRTDYRRLVSARGSDALARVERQTCQACLVRIRPNTQVALNMGKYVFCDSCGRLLYQPNEQ